MQAIKQEAITTIAQLSDSASIEEIIAALEKIRDGAACESAEHPVDACFGALGSGRRTDVLISELRDEP
jgi:hypothetical protein